ncbi:MAG: hypothetical protein WC568_10740 [Candidatus Methanoperedens sp.]
MIKIDSEQKKIHFFTPYRARKESRTPPSLTFDLISAYICPVCGKILRAYYIGMIPKHNIDNYIEKIGSNELPELQLSVGNAGGGQYLKTTSHFDKYSRSGNSCKWEEIPLRGVKTCLEALFEKLDTHKKGYTIPEKLIELVSKNEFEGIKLVPDVCGKDLPMLIFNEDMLVDIGQDKEEDIDFEKRWKRKENIINSIMEKLGIGECPT